MGCLRRHTFCQQRQKVCKKRRQNQGFEILSAPHAGNVVIMRPTRLENFARGLKCSIVSALADEARRFRGSVPIGGHEVDGDRLTRRYSEKTMQNFVHVLPTPSLVDRKGSQETMRLLARLLGTFCASRKYPSGGTDTPILPPIPHQNPPHYVAFNL